MSQTFGLHRCIATAIRSAGGGYPLTVEPYPRCQARHSKRHAGRQSNITVWQSSNIKSVPRSANRLSTAGNALLTIDFAVVSTDHGVLTFHSRVRKPRELEAFLARLCRASPLTFSSATEKPQARRLAAAFLGLLSLHGGRTSRYQCRAHPPNRGAPMRCHPFLQLAGPDLRTWKE